MAHRPSFTPASFQRCTLLTIPTKCLAEFHAITTPIVPIISSVSTACLLIRHILTDSHPAPRRGRPEYHNPSVRVQRVRRTSLHRDPTSMECRRYRGTTMLSRADDLSEATRAFVPTIHRRGLRHALTRPPRATRPQTGVRSSRLCSKSSRHHAQGPRRRWQREPHYVVCVIPHLHIVH